MFTISQFLDFIQREDFDFILYCVTLHTLYKDLYGILQLLRGYYLTNFPLKTLKLGWVAFHSVAFQLKYLDFQSDQYKKLVSFLSRFCNWLLSASRCPIQSLKPWSNGS